MRRKNRKWAAMAAGLYLLVMVSAYRWAVSQRLPEGSIFNKIERDGIRRLAEEKAKADAAEPKPMGESRLTAAGPAFVAARYDATHVVFMLAAETESRFSSSPLVHADETPTKVPAPSTPAAPLAGLQELWEPDSQALHFFPEIIQETQPGEQWTLSLSPDSTIPVVIDRTVVAPTGCSLALGFLATVPAVQQAAFAASSRDYFAVRRTAVASADPPVASHIGELPQAKLLPSMAKQIEEQLNDRMKQEVLKIDARLLANAGSPGATAGESPLGSARPQLKEWIHADQGLTRGEGKLDYDFRGFRLTPDGAPRLFVRARWKLADATVFLMTAWFRADVPKAEEPQRESRSGSSMGADVPLVLLFADSSWSTALREGDAAARLGDKLDFETILNEFDADHDGWAELLIHSHDAHSNGGPSTAITLYLYTDLGLVPMKTPFRRDGQSPESCLDP
jgi:hypothetical protein